MGGGIDGPHSRSCDERERDRWSDKRGGYGVDACHSTPPGYNVILSRGALLNNERQRAQSAQPSGCGECWMQTARDGWVAAAMETDAAAERGSDPVMR